MAKKPIKEQLNVLLYPREIGMLKQAATAYRSPSLNWFVAEMITAMLNPDLWQDFQRRLTTGAQQLTLAMPAEDPAPKPKAKPRKKRRRA